MADETPPNDPGGGDPSNPPPDPPPDPQPARPFTGDDVREFARFAADVIDGAGTVLRRIAATVRARVAPPIIGG